MNNPIHPDTRMGPVHLAVSSLARTLPFYRERLGLTLHAHDGATARLGAGGADLVVLTDVPGATRTPGTTGLYHFAILTPSRLELARLLQHLAETRTPLQGFADHLVSEAIYLADPEGNGIEIYRDRPRQEWQRDAEGRLRMASDPLDIDGLLDESKQAPPWSGIHPSTVMGHMHLQVAGIEQAERFYGDILGFERVLRYGPSASFLSAGGYHHHIGVNTWAGVGAPPPAANAQGMRWLTIVLPNQNELGRVVERVRSAGIAVVEHAEGILVRDPSQNGVMLTT